MAECYADALAHVECVRFSRTRTLQCPSLKAFLSAAVNAFPFRVGFERRLRTEGKETTHGDRKSTRLNSSHGSISYAVFCLKKKKNVQDREPKQPLHIE